MRNVGRTVIVANRGLVFQRVKNDMDTTFFGTKLGVSDFNPRVSRLILDSAHGVTAYLRFEVHLERRNRRDREARGEGL